MSDKELIEYTKLQLKQFGSAVILMKEQYIIMAALIRDNEFRNLSYCFTFNGDCMHLKIEDK